MRKRRHPGGSRLLKTLILIFTLGACSLLPQWAEAQTAAPDTVTSVEIVGNVTVDSDLVRRGFGLQVGARYSSDAVRRGIRRLNDLGFFADIAVEGEIEGKGIHLTIRLVENPRVASVEYTGNKKIKKDKVTELTGTLIGRMADDRLLADVTRKLTRAYAEKGYSRAIVRPRYLPGDSDTRRILLVEVEEGPKVRVEAIRVIGNRQLDEETLVDAMDQGTTGFLSGGVLKPTVLEQDMEKLEEEMARRGFRDGRVSGYEVLPGSHEDRVVVEIVVEEGPKYTIGSVTWAGNSVMPSAYLYGLTQVRSGSVFNQERIAKTLEEAYGVYADRGYIYLSIQPDYTTVDSTVDVSFRVIEGEPSHIRNLIITGNTRTKEKVIRRQMALRPGDLFRRNLLIRSQRELAQLGFFKDFSVDTRPVADSRDIDLILGVEERQVGTASAGFGFSSSVGLTGFMELGHSNLFGNAQTVSLRLERGSQRNNAEISFTEPWFKGSPTTVGVDLFSTNRVIQGSPTLEIKNTGGALRLGRPLPLPYTRAFATYRLSNQTVTEETGFILADSLEFFQTGFRLDQRTALTSSLALSLTRNSTDHPIYPTVGSNTRLRVEWTGGPLGGDLVFQKYEIDYAKYLSPKKVGPLKPTLMLRTRLGMVGEAFRNSPIVPTHWIPDPHIPPGSVRADTLDTTLGGEIPVPIPRYTLVFPPESNELFRLGGTTYQALRGYEDFEIIPDGNVLTRYDVTAITDTTGGTDYRVNATRVYYPGGRYAGVFTAELQFPIADPLHGLFLADVGGTWNDVHEFRWGSLHKSLGIGLRMEVPLLGLIGFDYAYGFDRLDRVTGKYTRSAWQPHIQFGRIF